MQLENILFIFLVNNVEEAELITSAFVFVCVSMDDRADSKDSFLLFLFSKCKNISTRDHFPRCCVRERERERGRSLDFYVCLWLFILKVGRERRRKRR